MTGPGEKQGLATVLDAAVEPLASDDGAARQLDLLSADEEPGASPLDAALERMAEGFSTPRRGRGRPAGSRNRRTEDWQRLVLSTHRSPLLVLADFYSMPVEELAARLQCSRLDAAKLQMAAARDLAPYLHQRLPQALSLDVNGTLPILHLHMGAPAGAVPAGSSGSDVLEIVATDIVENQGLSIPALTHSDGVHSDSAAGSVGNSGEVASEPTDLGSVSGGAK
ncbi:hypothetical protein [Azospirillum sp. sgz302134]